MTRPAPAGGRILTGGTKVLLALAGLAGAIVAWRFAVGLGPATGLNDGYPWGLWITFDVVIGTALACGGYAVALLVYVLNRGRYHPLVRPALLTSALGYSVAGVAVVIDLGRPWWTLRIPVSPHLWNLNSALLEVALCIMAYMGVLWIELAPAFLERWKEEGSRPRLRRLAGTAATVVDRSMVWIIALGLLLPTMHQSSLGTVMLLTGPKLHPLWHTPWVPLLFLVSSFTMGFALVTLESLTSSQLLGRPAERKMLAGLWGAAAVTALLFVAVRVGDLVGQGEVGTLFRLDGMSLLVWLEIALFALPAALWLDSRRRTSRGDLLYAALLFAFGGALYRFDTYLVAYQPGPGWAYFPTVPEILVTVGLVATEILIYVALVKRFPILAGRGAEAGAH